MITKEILLKYKINVEDESSIAEAVYEKILTNYMEEIDEVVESIERVIKDIESGEISRYSNEDLELIAIKIPTLMYKLGGNLERMGIRYDFTKALKEFNNNEIFIKSAGTVTDRKSIADNDTKYEELLENVYKRVYKQIERRLSYVDSLYNSVKKVITLRIAELEVFRRENATNNYVNKEKKDENF